MVLDMKGNSEITKLMDKAPSNGKMEEVIQDLGRIVKCMEEEYLFSVMVESMMENILMILKKEKEDTTGMMKSIMKENS